MRRTCVMLGVVGAGVLCGAEAPARADGVVIESRVAGESRPDDDSILPYFRGELSERGFLADPGQLSARIEEVVSRQQQPLAKTRHLRVVEEVENGYREFREGHYNKAIKLLTDALRVQRSHPAAVTGDSSLKRAMLRAHIGLALSCQRSRKISRAKEIMAELIRSFPDHEISYAEYGPEPRTLYRKVEEKLHKEGDGVLEVVTDNPNAAIIINERYAGIGRVSEKHYAGRYRVYAQLADKVGRVHVVDVIAGDTARVELEWNFDHNLRTSDRSVALVFASEDERTAQEKRLAMRLAEQMGASTLIIVGFRGDRLVASRLAMPDGKVMKEAALDVGDAIPPARRIRALAATVAGDAVGPNIDVRVADGERRRDRPFASKKMWKWAAIGTGAAGIGVGAWLISIDGEGTCSGAVNCPETHQTLGLGVGAVVVGSALVGTGIYLWTRERRSKSGAGVAVAPYGDGWVVAVSGRF